MLLILTACFISLVILKYFILPWAWMLGLWALTFVRLCIVSQDSIRKAIWVNLAAVLFGLALFEAYLGLKNSQVTSIETPMPYMRNDLLGYSLKKNITVKKFFGPELQWEATYTINSDGQRISTSPGLDLQTSRCVPFFGGSFTFGTAVEDSQTLPSQLQAQSAGRVRSINFGVSGYGPHHVLALLENELEILTLRCEPAFGIYQSIPHHISRVAGTAFWDNHEQDPRYELQEDGMVKRTGTFAEYSNLQAKSSLKNTIWEKITDQFKKSKIAKKAFEIYHWERYSDEDIALFISVVEKAKFIFETRYPESEFLVVYWDILDKLSSDNVIQQLRDRRIRVIQVERILPPRTEGYLLERYANHPPPEAHQLIAEYLVKHVLED